MYLQALSSAASSVESPLLPSLAYAWPSSYEDGHAHRGLLAWTGRLKEGTLHPSLLQDSPPRHSPQTIPGIEHRPPLQVCCLCCGCTSHLSEGRIDRDALERETEALRKQVATLRAEQSSHLKETRCESAISAPTRTVPSSATRSGVTSAGSEFYAGLNGELAALREAIASLTAEARDIEARSNPPPAYN